MPSSALEATTRLAVAILSLLVFIVGAVAYSRRPTRRMLLVLALFLVFLVQGAILAFELVTGETTSAESAYFAFQFVEIALVAVILLKR